ncbi:MAG: GntR family transcriptional regulator [Opitutaceae bacterium]|nr:GntR family transcriptional regulator [Opitutaceae bacterium]
MDINSDIAYDYIRKRILNGEYSPGQALMAKSLAAELRLSPTPVRDALRQLEADGLVTIKARLGASVNTMDLKEFQDLCELRLILESHTAGLAAMRRTDSDLRGIWLGLEAMTRLTAELETAAKEQPLFHELENADVRFHLAIISAARNDMIRKQILRLHLINRLVPGIGIKGPEDVDPDSPAERAKRNAHRREVLVEHRTIYDAIERRDVEGASKAMKKSLEGMFDLHIRAIAHAEQDSMAKEYSVQKS